MKRCSLVWLQNDLRLHDHPALEAALSRSEPMVLAWGAREKGKTWLGRNCDASANSEAFAAQGLRDLRARVPVHILHGETVSAISRLVRDLGERDLQVSAIVFNETQVASHEQRTYDRLEELAKSMPGVECLRFPWAATMMPLDKLPRGKRFSSFSGFRKAVEGGKLQPLEHRVLRVPAERVIPAPAGSAYDEVPREPSEANLTFSGGEKAAWARLDHFLEHGVEAYRQTRNGMLGDEYSSRLSPYLAQGSLSARAIAARVRNLPKQSEGSRWLIVELLWRDWFFLDHARKGDAYFRREAVDKKWLRGSKAEAHFQAWVEGRTGTPIVDAAMRELAATGFMGNRARQIAASFLVNDLKVDWRLGAQYFETQLLDNCVSQNFGNWIACTSKYFHSIKQAHVYDPDSRYIKHWLPALAHLEPRFAIQPEKAPRNALKKAPPLTPGQTWYASVVPLPPLVSLSYNPKSFKRNEFQRKYAPH